MTGSEWALTRGGLGHVYAITGKNSEALAMLDELRQLSTREYVPAPSMAIAYAGLGEKDQAFAWLEKGYEERAFQMQWLTVEPRWDSLRSDPRFKDLVKRRLDFPNKTFAPASFLRPEAAGWRWRSYGEGKSELNRVRERDFQPASRMLYLRYRLVAAPLP